MFSASTRQPDRTERRPPSQYNRAHAMTRPAVNVVATVAALAVVVTLCCTVASAAADESGPAANDAVRPDDHDVRTLMDMVDGLLDAADTYRLAPGVMVKRSVADAPPATAATAAAESADRVDDPEKYFVNRLARYAGSHVLDVNFSEMFRSAGRTFSLKPHLRE